jgi:hypothetical protein
MGRPKDLSRRNMTDVPEGARLSDDGQWWWDESAQQWQPVPGAASASGSSSTGGADEQGGDGSGGDGGASSSGDGGQAAARVAAGLPAALTEITDDQRAAYIGESQVSAEPEDMETVETLAMNDSGENGEEMA